VTAKCSHSFFCSELQLKALSCKFQALAVSSANKMDENWTSGDSLVTPP